MGVTGLGGLDPFHNGSPSTTTLLMKAFALALLLGLHIQSAYAQPTGGMPKTTEEQEKRFVNLEVPSPYSYQEGTMQKMEVDGKRIISFTGTTAMPPYFEYVKNSRSFERAAWQKQLLLSKGRWVFKYQVDCESRTFDREGDLVGWRDIYLDPTSYAAHTLFCSEADWARLPQAKPSTP